MQEKSTLCFIQYHLQFLYEFWNEYGTQPDFYQRYHGMSIMKYCEESLFTHQLVSNSHHNAKITTPSNIQGGKLSDTFTPLRDLIIYLFL